MDDVMRRFEDYLERLKQQGEKIPKWTDNKIPHLRVISAASGVAYRHLNTPVFRQRLELAVQTIGMEVRQVTKRRTDDLFDRNRLILSNYLRALKDNGHKLPSHPKHSGQIFYAQVEAESGLNTGALSQSKCNINEEHRAHLREMVGHVASQTGVEVRVLPQPLMCKQISITYEIFLKKGTAERGKELAGRPSPRQQLYNTRSALNKYRQHIGLDVTAQVGNEFVNNFEHHVEQVTEGISNTRSRRKFQTEIYWWRNFYNKLVNDSSLPQEFHKALSQLIENSGLSVSLLSKLIGMSQSTLDRWYRGQSFPETLKSTAIRRIEILFKLPAGTLVSRVSCWRQIRRFRSSKFPAFLRHDRSLANKVRHHLPDNFCELPCDKQQEIVYSISEAISNADDPYWKKLSELRKLPYQLKHWPVQLEREFEDLVSFKSSPRPPLGMMRKGQWKRPATKQMARGYLAALFGAICLPSDAEDVRIRGLGVNPSHLTLAFVTCPTLVDWFVRFKWETRNNYTDDAIKHLINIMSMLRKGTGWLRQRPYLATRLRPICVDSIEIVSARFVAEASSDWDRVCEDAIAHYKCLADEIKPLVRVSRDPFQRIEGIVKMDNPIKAFEILIQGMMADLPNPHARPVFYHTWVRNLVLISLIAVTGFRRSTVHQLNYTGDDSGHLFYREGKYVLAVPRSLFKNEESPYFGTKNTWRDYYMELPDVFGLYNALSQYLNTSRAFLLNKYYPDCKDHPLFVTTRRSEIARMSPTHISDVYVHATEKHLMENKACNRGIKQVKRHRPHSARHIRGTASIKLTGSPQIAADSIQTSTWTAQRSYARFLPEDRNRRVNDVFFNRE